MECPIEIEICDYPNPDYQYGIFRIDGVEIGRPDKRDNGWTLRGKRKVLAVKDVAIALLKKNIVEAESELIKITKELDLAKQQLIEVKRWIP